MDNELEKEFQIKESWTNPELAVFNLRLEPYKIENKDKKYLTVGGWFLYLKDKGIITGKFSKEDKGLSNTGIPKIILSKRNQFQEMENKKSELDKYLDRKEYAINHPTNKVQEKTEETNKLPNIKEQKLGFD